MAKWSCNYITPSLRAYFITIKRKKSSNSRRFCLYRILFTRINCYPSTLELMLFTMCIYVCSHKIWLMFVWWVGLHNNKRQMCNVVYWSDNQTIRRWKMKNRKFVKPLIKLLKAFNSFVSFHFSSVFHWTLSSASTWNRK